MKGRKLTLEETRRRRALYAQGLDDAAIAAAVGVERSSITTWRRREKLPCNPRVRRPALPPAHRSKPEREAKRFTLRPCLRCQAEIESEGPHHRLCDRCRRAGADLPRECTVSL